MDSSFQSPLYNSLQKSAGNRYQSSIFTKKSAQPTKGLGYLITKKYNYLLLKNLFRQEIQPVRKI